jgi:hypothetical protein
MKETLEYHQCLFLLSRHRNLCLKSQNLHRGSELPNAPVKYLLKSDINQLPWCHRYSGSPFGMQSTLNGMLV